MADPHATSSVVAGGTAASTVATGGVAASAAAVSTGMAGAASTAGSSALIPVLAGVGTAGSASKVAAVLVAGAIVAGVVTQPHGRQVGAPHAHQALVVGPTVAQGTPTPPPPSSVRYATTGDKGLVGLSNAPQGLVFPTASPTMVSGLTSAPGRGPQNGPPTAGADAIATGGVAVSPTVTPILVTLSTGQVTATSTLTATSTPPDDDAKHYATITRCIATSHDALEYLGLAARVVQTVYVYDIPALVIGVPVEHALYLCHRLSSGLIRYAGPFDALEEAREQARLGL